MIWKQMEKFFFGRPFYEGHNFKSNKIRNLVPEKIKEESPNSSGIRNYSSIIGGSNIIDLSIVNSYNLATPYDAIRPLLLVSGFLTHVPPITRIGNGNLRFFNSLTDFSSSQNISIQSLKNLVEYMYNIRFYNKQNFTGNKITLNLQPFNYTQTQLGSYRNSAKPRSVNEFIYKLVENPDNEDINEYEVLYNLDPITELERKYDAIVELDIEISEPKEMTFEISTYNRLESRLIYIEWGNGNTSEYKARLDNQSKKARTLRNYFDTPGSYTVKMYMNDIDKNHGVVSYFSSSVNNPLDIIAIRVSSNLFINQPLRALQNLSNLQSYSFNEGKNNKAVMGGYFRETFEGCTSLRHISPLYVVQGETFEQTLEMFNNTGSIESVVLENMHLSFSIANNQLNGDALNALFEGLATVSTPQTITVTGNPGILESTYDPSIATLKGWTVVD